MNEIVGNVWDFIDHGYVVVTTNGIVKNNGEAVMGAGIAKEAAIRFPDLPRLLGIRLKSTGNRNYYFPNYKIMTFPTKNHWKDKSDVELIKQSAAQLNADIMTFRYQQRDIRFFLPRVGCGMGGLIWEDVKKIIQPYLNEPEITFVSK